MLGTMNDQVDRLSAGIVQDLCACVSSLNVQPDPELRRRPRTDPELSRSVRVEVAAVSGLIRWAPKLARIFGIAERASGLPRQGRNSPGRESKGSADG